MRVTSVTLLRGGLLLAAALRL